MLWFVVSPFFVNTLCWVRDLKLQFYSYFIIYCKMCATKTTWSCFMLCLNLVTRLKRWRFLQEDFWNWRSPELPVGLIWRKEHFFSLFWVQFERFQVSATRFARTATDGYREQRSADGGLKFFANWNFLRVGIVCLRFAGYILCFLNLLLYIQNFFWRSVLLHCCLLSVVFCSVFGGVESSPEKIDFALTWLTVPVLFSVVVSLRIKSFSYWPHWQLFYIKTWED